MAEYWDGLKLFVTNGRIEIDNNSVERTIERTLCRPRCRSRELATIASLIETCNLNPVDPLAYLTVALTAIVNCHKQSRSDELLPWKLLSQDR